MSLVVGTNSYITRSEANTLLADHPGLTEWTAISDAEKDVYLIEACMEIDTLPFSGTRSNSDQTLSWPRDFSTETDYAPDNLKIAQAEQALHLARNWEKIQYRLDMDDMNITDFGVGDVTEKRMRVRGMICRRALQRLSSYIHNYGVIEVLRT